MNQFLASGNIACTFKQTVCAIRQGHFVIALWVGSMWLAASSGAGPQIISMCLIMRCTPNSALVDRVDVATPLSLSSRSVTSLSALAPAQRAGAQRLCALGSFTFIQQRPVDVCFTPETHRDSGHSFSAAMGQCTKSLRDSPLRGVARPRVQQPGWRSSIASVACCLEDRGVVNLIRDRSFL